MHGKLRRSALPSRWSKWLREFWFGNITPLDENKLKVDWANKGSGQQSYVLETLRRERDKMADDLKTATGNVNTAITVLVLAIALGGSSLTASAWAKGWQHSAVVYAVGAIIVTLIWSYMPRTKEAWLRLRNKLPEPEECDTAEAEYVQLRQDIHADRRRLWRAYCYQGFALHLCALIVAIGCWAVAHR